jgi:hypothetical protein
MSKTLRSVACAVLLLLVAAPQVSAQRQPRRGGPGTGNPEEHLVPWKFIEKDVPPRTTPLTLYWLPASKDDTERSPLMASTALFEAATRCVDFQIVLPGSAAVVEKLGAAGKVPAALLADRDGHILRRADNVHGVLRADEVERMLNSELAARDEAMYREMREASREASAGNKSAAIALYQKIWDDRCLFTLAGTEAQRALKALGVVVQEPPAVHPQDPNLRPSTPPGAPAPPKSSATPPASSPQTPPARPPA